MKSYLSESHPKYKVNANVNNQVRPTSVSNGSGFERASTLLVNDLIKFSPVQKTSNELNQPDSFKAATQSSKITGQRSTKGSNQNAAAIEPHKYTGKSSRYMSKKQVNYKKNTRPATRRSYESSRCGEYRQVTSSRVSNFKTGKVTEIELPGQIMVHPVTGDIIQNMRLSSESSPGINTAVLRSSRPEHPSKTMNPQDYARFRLQEHIKQLAKPKSIPICAPRSQELSNVVFEQSVAAKYDTRAKQYFYHNARTTRNEAVNRNFTQPHHRAGNFMQKKLTTVHTTSNLMAQQTVETNNVTTENVASGHSFSALDEGHVKNNLSLRAERMDRNKVRVSLPHQMILKSTGKSKGVIEITDQSPGKDILPVYAIEHTYLYSEMYEATHYESQMRQFNTINIESNLSHYTDQKNKKAVYSNKHNETRFSSKSKPGDMQGVSLQGKQTKMFQNNFLSPKYIAAYKLKKRKKAILNERNAMQETLVADDLTLQQTYTPVADEKRGSSNHMTVIDGQCKTKAPTRYLRGVDGPSQYPTVTGLDLEMEGRIYASDGDRSRLDYSPDTHIKEMNAYMAEYEADYLHVMAPKQQHFQNESVKRGGKFGLGVNDLRSFHTSEAGGHSSALNSNDKTPPRQYFTAMTMNAHTRVSSHLHLHRTSKSLCYRFDQKARQIYDSSQKYSNRIYFKPSIVEVTEEAMGTSANIDKETQQNYLLQPHVQLDSARNISQADATDRSNPEQTLLYAIFSEEDLPLDIKHLENIAIDDPETREFIMYLQQVQPNIKLPDEFMASANDSKKTIDLDAYSPQSTIRELSPYTKKKLSPTLPKVSAMKRHLSDNPTMSIEDSKEKVQSEYKDEAPAITERVVVHSDKVSGGECEVTEHYNEEQKYDPHAKTADKHQLQA